MLLNQAAWQRSYLRRLDRAEEMANRMGVSREAIRAAFGHPLIPSTFGRQPPEELLDQHDAPALLDVIERGTSVQPVQFWNALAELFLAEKEPRPSWIAPDEPWPPGASSSAKKSAASKAESKAPTGKPR